MTMRALLLTAVLIGVAGGCRPQGSDSENANTNGIGVLTPVFEVGAADPDGEPVLLSAVGAARIADTVVVADNLGRALVYLDLQGRLLRRIGRIGSGPGEFRSLSWLDACRGDSLVVADLNQRRMTVFAPTGAYGREYAIPGSPGMKWACSRGGSMVMLGTPRRFLGPTEMGRHPPDSAALFRIDALEDTTTLIASVQLGEQRPMGLMTHIALSRDRVWVGTGESPYIHGYTLDGPPVDSLHVGTPQRRLTRPDYERGVDQMLGHMAGVETIKTLMLSAPMPEFMPHYGALKAAPDGTLWVVISASIDSVTTLRAFAPDNRVIGDVEFPYQTTILAAGPDYLITTHKTADGEPRLAMHTIRWRARGR